MWVAGSQGLLCRALGRPLTGAPPRGSIAPAPPLAAAMLVPAEPPRVPTLARPVEPRAVAERRALAVRAQWAPAGAGAAGAAGAALSEAELETIVWRLRDAEQAAELLAVERDEARCPPSPQNRTRVLRRKLRLPPPHPPLVLSGHAASLTPY